MKATSWPISIVPSSTQLPPMTRITTWPAMPTVSVTPP